MESALKMRFKRKPSKNRYFSPGPPSHCQILMVISFIFISWARYKETHEQEGKPGTQLTTVRGSSWQQPKLASSGTMKYLRRWNCHCLGFYSLYPASFARAASPRYGFWCGGRRHSPPLPSCLPALPHSCLHTRRRGPSILCPSWHTERQELQAKPPTPPPFRS